MSVICCWCCGFCPPEVIADDTKAIDSVLKADTKRLSLLEEERRLTALINEGNIEADVRDRLRDVGSTFLLNCFHHLCVYEV